MKHYFKQILTVCVAVCILLFSACQKDANGETDDSEFTPVDFVTETKLDMTSDTLKQEVTVKSFVDGDTTHFNVPTSISADGVLKARYLAVNTPESTGKIEEYGKKASKFTKETLSKATSIVIESDNSKWNIDSTGGRNLVWVWYRTSDTEEYRNLNIELLQNGLAIASSSANNRYGETCVKAIAQAKKLKLNIYSGEKDPDFFYGDAYELTLKEVRTNLEKYLGNKVAFEGVITKNNDNAVFVEEYDPETDMYNGIMVYYGFGLNGDGLGILSVGNRVRIVGSLQYYENGGTYQISGVTYKQMKPNDPNNIQKIGSGYTGAFKETTADTFVNGKVSISTDDGVKEFRYAELAMDTTVTMSDLEVVDTYTTDKESSSSYGAITLTCKCGEDTVIVRTIPLHDEDKKLVTSDVFENKNITVKGLVSYYDGMYQIKVLSLKDIVINN